MRTVRIVFSIMGVCLVMVAIWASYFISGCSSTVPMAKTVISIDNSVCTALAQNLQTEPEWLQMECAVASAAGQISKFLVKMPNRQVEGYCVMKALKKAAPTKE